MKKIIIVLILLVVSAGCLTFHYFYPDAGPILNAIVPMIAGVFGFFAGTWASNLKASKEIFEEMERNKHLHAIRDDQLALQRKFRGFPALPPGVFEQEAQSLAELDFDNDLNVFCRKTLERLELPIFVTVPLAFAIDPWKNTLLELMRGSSRFRSVTAGVIETKTATGSYCRLLKELLEQVEAEQKIVSNVYLYTLC